MGISASHLAPATPHRRLRLAPLAILASACGTAAWAVPPIVGPVTLPAAGYASYLYAYGDYPTPTTLDQGSSNPGTSTLSNVVQRTANGVPVSSNTYASTTTSNAHGGSVTATAHENNFDAAATGVMSYYFTIIGPDADFVPITISGYGGVDINGFYNWDGGYARMQVNYQEKDHQIASSLIEQFGNHESGNFSDVINVQPNLNGRNANTLTLSASVAIGSSSGFDLGGYYSAEGTAFIDPIISIADPRLASLYTIVYGLPDFETPPPSGAVPEPASWAMMLSGFGAIGGAMRSRRKAAVIAG